MSALPEGVSICVGVVEDDPTGEALKHRII
jgi:hypothetical protein